MNDTALKKSIKTLQMDIVALAQKFNYNAFKFWNYLEYHNQEPEETESCAGVLTCDEGMLAALDGHTDPDFEPALERITEKHGFYLECQTHGSFHIYSHDDNISDHFRNLLQWQWMTHLIQPEYTTLYNELFAYFEKNPDKLYSLKPRQLEFYVGEIFRNQGYDVEMGPGTNDGGIDLRLYQKQDIDQITTLVQVKRYKKSLPIRLDAVAALYGHVEAEKAQDGLFVTTSRYLPGTRNFASRLSKKITLSDSNDLVNWSSKVKTAIIRNKESLVSDQQLLKLVDEVNSRKKNGLILVHHVHSGMVYCEYALLLKETKFAALLIMLPKKVSHTYDPPYNSRGHELPVLDHTILQHRTNEYLFRATVSTYENGSKAYRGRSMHFTSWNGEPGYFDLND
jgi:hypothetical protein